MDKVLIVEDDSATSELLSLHLGEAGFHVTCASDGIKGLELGRLQRYDLIILDLILPGKGGLEICRELRKEDPATPIMMLTSRGEEVDKVLGLELGADDYVSKPFSSREVVARAKALCRRSRASRDGREIAIHTHGLTIDPGSRTVQLSGKTIDLTSTEFDLLLFLAKNAGRAFTREHLLNRVWGYTSSVYEHTVNTHINRLRMKIEESPAAPFFIQTVWGVGYRFVSPDAQHQGIAA
jgi:DNA-binding response OmpR family regulator